MNNKQYHALGWALTYLLKQIHCSCHGGGDCERCRIIREIRSAGEIDE